MADLYRGPMRIASRVDYEAGVIYAYAAPVDSMDGAIEVASLRYLPEDSLDDCPVFVAWINLLQAIGSALVAEVTGQRPVEMVVEHSTESQA
jgi:hypothetical protein